MNISLNPGKYVMAVSGGVDSVVLLDVLAGIPGIDLIIAHFDHGIRADSGEDAELVRKLAEKYGLPFELGSGQLGPDASEAEARQARYDFLRRVQKEHGAVAIITAHHQDDILETAVINMSRGTGSRGLASLRSRGDVVRPALHLTKSELRQYAESAALSWREDSTNSSPAYLRNRIRANLAAKADDEWRRRMLSHIAKAGEMNEKLEREVSSMLGRKLVRGQAAFARKWFVMLPHVVASEVVHALLRKLQVPDINRPLVERLVLGIKTMAPGKKLEIDGQFYVLMTKRSARVINKQTGKTVRV